MADDMFGYVWISSWTIWDSRLYLTYRLRTYKKHMFEMFICPRAPLKSMSDITSSQTWTFRWQHNDITLFTPACANGVEILKFLHPCGYVVVKFTLMFRVKRYTWNKQYECQHNFWYCHHFTKMSHMLAKHCLYGMWISFPLGVEYLGNLDTSKKTRLDMLASQVYMLEVGSICMPFFLMLHIVFVRY